MPNVRLTGNGLAHLQVWVSWFAKEEYRPRSKFLINALVGYFTANEEELCKQSFEWNTGTVGPYVDKNVDLSAATHRKLVELAKNRMNGAKPDAFLARLLEFYAQDENALILRETLCSKVIDDHYREDTVKIAFDVPVEMLPKGVSVPIPDELVREATKKMVKDLSGKDVQIVSDALAKANDEANSRGRSKRFTFVVIDVPEPFKQLLANATPVTKFTACVVHYWVKTLSLISDRDKGK